MLKTKKVKKNTYIIETKYTNEKTVKDLLKEVINPNFKSNKTN